MSEQPPHQTLTEAGEFWLAAHWGITDRLRQVVERPGTGRRLANHHTAIGYGFFTDGETPHAAIAELGARWPALRFLLVPRPATERRRHARQHRGCGVKQRNDLACDLLR